MRAALESLLRARKLDVTLTYVPGALGPAARAAGARRALPSSMPRWAAGSGAAICPRSRARRRAAARRRRARRWRRRRRAAKRSRWSTRATRFDPASAAARGLDLSRLLWVASQASARRAATMRSRALKAFSLILQAGGFGLVVLDLADVPAAALRRFPVASTWMRLARIVEGSDTVALLVGERAHRAQRRRRRRSRSSRRPPRWQGDANRARVFSGIDPGAARHGATARDSVVRRSDAGDSRRTRSRERRSARAVSARGFTDQEIGSAGPQRKQLAPDRLTSGSRRVCTRACAAVSCERPLTACCAIARDFSPRVMRVERAGDPARRVGARAADRRAAGDRGGAGARDRGGGPRGRARGDRADADGGAAAGDADCPIVPAMTRLTRSAGRACCGRSRRCRRRSITAIARGPTRPSNAGALRRWAIWPRCRPPSCRRGSGAAAWRCSGSRAASIRGRSCPTATRRATSAGSSSSGRSRRSSRCRSCSRGCSSRCRPRSSAPIAARPRSASICGSPTATRITRVLQLPAPMRDPRVLRTLLLLDLESHPAVRGASTSSPIELDPAPARITQFSLLERALPSPETLSTLTARLSALVGEARFGSPVLARYAPARMRSRCSGSRLSARANGADGATQVLMARSRAVPNRGCTGAAAVSVTRAGDSASASSTGGPVHRRPASHDAACRRAPIVAGRGPWRTSAAGGARRSWWQRQAMESRRVGCGADERRRLPDFSGPDDGAMVSRRDLRLAHR